MNIILPRHTERVAMAALSAVLLLGFIPTLIAPPTAPHFALAVVFRSCACENDCPETNLCTGFWSVP